MQAVNPTIDSIITKLAIRVRLNISGGQRRDLKRAFCRRICDTEAVSVGHSRPIEKLTGRNAHPNLRANYAIRDAHPHRVVDCPDF